MIGTEFRTNRLHCVRTQMVFDNIHSRNTQFTNVGYTKSLWRLRLRIHCSDRSLNFMWFHMIVSTASAQTPFEGTQTTLTNASPEIVSEHSTNSPRTTLSTTYNGLNETLTAQSISSQSSITGMSLLIQCPSIVAHFRNRCLWSKHLHVSLFEYLVPYNQMRKCGSKYHDK